MKVSEFIEWLKTQDQDAKVQVLGEYSYNCELQTEWTDFDPIQDSSYVEFGLWTVLRLGNC